MIWLPVLMTGGVLYASGKALQRVKKPAWFARQPAATDVQQADREMVVSAASLGVAAAGGLLALPVLGWLSLPVSLYLFVPVIREAGQVVGKERRVNDQVLTTARLGVCVVMGYTFIAALDAGLHTLMHRIQVRNEAAWRQALRQRFGEDAQPLVAWLEQTSQQPTAAQQLGERMGSRAAPLMLATCVLSTPVLGINRSAAFLTTFFGSHLRKLGPYTAHEFMRHALEQDILLTHPQLLDQAHKVDTVVFDGRILHDTVVCGQFGGIVRALRQQQRAVYVFADTDDRAGLIRQWQEEGKTVGYVGSGNNDLPAMQAANLAILHRHQVLTEGNVPHILLPRADLLPVLTVFELADTFASRQQFNLLAPIGVDVVDIATTLLLDFGLVYSVIFTYAGLMLGMGSARLPKLPQDKGQVVDPSLLVGQCQRGRRRYAAAPDK
ncbi:hypothetical protein J9253_01195 [Thiothrix litoralis]|uniref:Uncharacterized protein n=1 Tax=Thiothrix litoralis TaxID=2891210 RepID=A0ABX7X0C9_9GAMM|nr:hypothetical protein [Thiothrix litoralis]QTR46605.1 hypothetical protein J9253_01195 [Thiothrix litoralis]